MLISRAFNGLTPALVLLALALCSCGGQEAVVLSITAPPGTLIRSYSVDVQDRGTRKVVFHAGTVRFDKGRDLSANPIRLGLQFDQQGTFLVHVSAARIAELETLPRDPKDPGAEPEYFFATIHSTFTVPQIDALLLPVAPQFDRDRDHFPDLNSWLASDAQAAEIYASRPEVLDCLDLPPLSGSLLPLSLGPADIHPLARPLCNVKLRPPPLSPTAEPSPFEDLDVSCGGQPRTCEDADGDGDPAQTDCDDFDPRRFHGNPKPRNCCQCQTRQECETNHAKIADLSLCQPPRCSGTFDFDCTGQSIDCFVDEDCDGYAANDLDPKKRDCDDNDDRVHPDAKVICDPAPEDANKDWACDGNPKKGCVPCDLDGDGFQRSGNEVYSDTKCPSAEYMRTGKPIDCDDTDRGVFPGSSGTEGLAPLSRDLSKTQMGGTVAGAMRGLCRNTDLDGVSPQNTNCDGKPRVTCPNELAADPTCDKDGDGFPSEDCLKNHPELAATFKADCLDDPALDQEADQIFPGAPLKCPTRQGDRNCDGFPDICGQDQDNDGYPVGSDCNDSSADSHPFAFELCDGRDNDCDGLIDEGNPSATGARMIEALPSGQKTVLSCNDSKVGLCGTTKRKDAARFSGRCVCTAFVPKSINQSSQSVIPGGRDACPGEPAPLAEPKDSDRAAPRCFDAYQPVPQTCDADRPEDNDCDGRNDAPDGKNLLEAIKEFRCGVAVGQCTQGRVIGCDRRKISLFSRQSTPPRSVPGYDENQRFYVCDNTVVAPKDEVCNGKDDDCDGQLPTSPAAKDERDRDGDKYMPCSPCDPQDLRKTPAGQVDLKGCADCNDGRADVNPGASESCDGVDNKCKGTGWTPLGDDGKEDCAVAPNTACCSAQCVDTKSDTRFCGSCTNACNPQFADRCDMGTCKCNNEAPCNTLANPAKAVCKPMAGCVECLVKNDCKTATRPYCDNTNVCTQCTTDAECNTDPTKPACKKGATPIANSCVECTDSMAHCKNKPGKTQCNPTTNACVECLDDTFCRNTYGNSPAAKPYCVNNACVQCKDATQCTDARLGDACSAGTCTCKGGAACNIGNKLYCGAPANACVACVVPATDCDKLSDACRGGSCSCGNLNKPCDTTLADNCAGGQCLCGNMSCDPARANQCKDMTCKCGANNQCDTNLTSRCDNGTCKCGNIAPCDKDLASKCDSATGTCKCGNISSCDPKLADKCDGNNSKCKCGNIDACDPVRADKCDAANNKCFCGAIAACDPLLASACDAANNRCRCGNIAACNKDLASTCDAANNKCKCGGIDSCDPVLASKCDGANSKCFCGNVAACDSRYADKCDAANNKCKCGDAASCDPARASRCDGANSKCFCGAIATCDPKLSDKCDGATSKCSCGALAAPAGSTKACNEKLASQCKDGACMCGNIPACDPKLSDECKADDDKCLCNGGNACKANETDRLCKSGTGCVQCLADVDCKSKAANACNADNKCVCANNGDCFSNDCDMATGVCK